MTILYNYGTTLCLLTEIWIQSTVSDAFALKSAAPNGYTSLNLPRPDAKRGGGLAVIHQDSIKCRDITKNYQKCASFEYMVICVRLKGVSLNICELYRPQSSCHNGMQRSTFIDKCSQILESFDALPGKLIIAVDSNIQWDKTSVFLLEYLDMMQLVVDPTHILRYTLDYVIGRNGDNIITDVAVNDLISDNYAVHAYLRLAKPHNLRRLFSIVNGNRSV